MDGWIGGGKRGRGEEEECNFVPINFFRSNILWDQQSVSGMQCPGCLRFGVCVVCVLCVCVVCMLCVCVCGEEGGGGVHDSCEGL